MQFRVDETLSLIGVLSRSRRYQLSFKEVMNSLKKQLPVLRQNWNILHTELLAKENNNKIKEIWILLPLIHTL